MKGWLDNYNDSKVSVPEGFQGEGYSNKGRNYSPAWGGQFQDGGFIPTAQKGRNIPATRADSLAVYNDAVNSKNYYEKTYSKFYEKPKVLSYDPTFWRMEDLKKAHLEHHNVTPANKQKIRQNKNPNQYLISDMITGAIDPKAPLLRYDRRIKPQGLIDYTPKNYLVKELEKIDKRLFDDKNDKLRGAFYSALGGGQMTKSEKALYDKWKASHPHDLKNLRKLSKLDDYIGRNTPGYITTLPYYDPIAVKPFNMLTDAEKKVRVKKYGPSGVPKSYIKGIKDKLDKDPKPDKKPNPDKKLDADPKIRLQPDLPMVEAVNLPPMQQLASVVAPTISDVVRAPKSYDVSTQRYNMNGTNDYYSYDKKDVGYEAILKANAAAKAYNKDIEKRYGPQNEYRTEKSRQEAARRLEQLRQDVQVRPNYQMGGSVYPVNYVPEAQMGASIPGAVGFSYARTQSPAPDNGPGAKKTMASAQNGVKTKKDKLKKLETLLKNPPVFKKKNFEDDLKERPREMVRDNTRVVFRDEKGRQKTANPNRQVSTKYNAVEEAKRKEQETKAMLADRKARIEDSILAQDEDIIGNPNWREVMARETQAIGDKFRLFPEEDSFFDDYLNPAVMIGNMATDLGQAPYYAKEQDSYMPYVTSIGIPLLTGGLEGIGAKTNKQFINNIANPFNVVPGYSAAKKYVGNKLGNISTNIAPKLEQPILSNASSFGNKTKSFLRNNVFTDKTFNRLETIDNGLNKSYRAVNPFHHIQAQKSLDEANSWMDNWYNDPITKEKIKEASSRFGPNSFNEEQLLKNIENKTYRSSFEANTNKVDNFLAGNPRVHKGNYGVSGYYLDAYKDQSKRQNLVDKYINPDMIRSTAIHEGNHGLTNGNQFIRGYEDVLQSPFDTANFKPRFDDGSFEKYSDYLLDPTEINARLSEIRYEHGLKPGENLTPERVNSIIDKGVSGKSKVDAEFFNLINDRNKFKDMMNYVPAAVPIAGGIGIASQMQNEEEVPGMKDGGVIKDDMGQWNHPGEITEIGSNQITMEGVPYPVLGISDTGDMQMMYPEEDYEFDGESVTEYPMAKNGIRQEQKGLVNLDQLTNFTNYNKPQPGGWLNKYN